MSRSISLRVTFILALAMTWISACDTSDSLNPLAAVTGANLYSYGDFCGAGRPELAGVTPQERLDELGQLTPRDTLDALCQAHDRCYERLGHDAVACDFAFTTGLGAAEFVSPDAYWSPDARIVDQQCRNQGLEITSGIAMKRSDLGEAGGANKNVVRREALGSLRASQDSFGFPDPRSGVCRAHNERLALDCAALGEEAHRFFTTTAFSEDADLSAETFYDQFFGPHHLTYRVRSQCVTMRPAPSAAHPAGCEPRLSGVHADLDRERERIDAFVAAEQETAVTAAVAAFDAAVAGDPDALASHVQQLQESGAAVAAATQELVAARTTANDALLDLGDSADCPFNAVLATPAPHP